MWNAKFADVNDTVLKRFKTIRNGNLVEIGSVVWWKTSELAQRLGHTEFNARSGRLKRFEEHHSIVFRNICGEVNSGDTSIINRYEWLVNR